MSEYRTISQPWSSNSIRDRADRLPLQNEFLEASKSIGTLMILYGTVRVTPQSFHPFLAVITDEEGQVVATLGAATIQDANDSIDDIKFRLNRLAVEKRAGKSRSQ